MSNPEMNTKPNFGIIVGRFQVHKLHEGHEELFRAVLARHNRVIVFLGVPAHNNMTKKHPLPYDVRAMMLKSRFPATDYNIEIHPLVDIPGDDAAWSRALDTKIREIAPIGDVTLYSARDGFAPYYQGRYKTHELDLEINVPRTISGENIRAEITNTVLASPDFRAGIIFARNHDWDKTIACVDIALCHFSDKGLMVGLGKRDSEGAYRFVGGHSIPSTPSYSADAKREAWEETKGLEVSSLFQIYDTRVDDPRWRGEDDAIKTILYVGVCPTMGGHGDDDIDEFRWFHVSELNADLFVPEHRPLFEAFRRFLNAPVVPQARFLAQFKETIPPAVEVYNKAIEEGK
jgi:bifunctional NMN adenylyltransferase/nudix hydrolase